MIHTRRKNTINMVAAIAVILSCFMVFANGWCFPTSSGTTSASRTSFQTTPISATILFSAATDDSSSSAAGIIEEVSEMRLSEIKAELNERKVDFSDCFDKESMIDKLVDARANNIDNSKAGIDESDEKEEESLATTSEESSSSETFDREAALEELQGMRVRELREELGRRRISRAGLFEKEDLVRALLEARAVASVFSGTGLLTPGEVSDLGESDVQKEIDHPGSLMLLDVYATWCGPCQMIAPVLKEIAAEEGDRLRVVKMDSDQNQSLASKLRVNGLPTLVLFKGGEEIDRLEGAPTKDQLVGWIESRR